MPSVKCFAECLLLGTRQRDSLPSAALGKLWHSAKSALPSGMHSVKKEFNSRQRFTLGKTPSSYGSHPTVTLCRVPAVMHSAKFFLIIIL
jgi:hypothetical protein